VKKKQNTHTMKSTLQPSIILHKYCYRNDKSCHVSSPQNHYKHNTTLI